MTLVMLLMFFGPVSFADTAREGTSSQPIFYTYGDTTKPGTRINAAEIYGEDVIVLPSTVSAESVILYCDNTDLIRVAGSFGEADFVSGEPLNLTELCGTEEYLLTFMSQNTKSTDEYKLHILLSDNLPAVYLSSDYPDTEGREWVESDADKSNKATGTLIMQRNDGEIVYDGALSQIKGRGNSTWGFIKKPYQIKLDKKTDLLETGDKDNESKTWILLANYLDPVGIRNTLALNLGSALGMQTNIQGKSVDMYYDGEYRGTYMLTEKAEVGSGRVDVTDLEEENEKANEGTDLESFPIAHGTTANGAYYTYCEGMNSPDDITGGYLLEMDYMVRALEEISYFCTKRGIYVVVKSPEYASKEEMNYIATLYQEYEDAVFNGGIHPETGKKYSDYVDARSVACYYLVNEFSKARDCFNSSAYLYKDTGDSTLSMGPLWDYDLSFGKGSYDSYYDDDSPNGISALNTDMGMALLRLDDFYNLTKEIYINEFLPIVQNVILGDADSISEDGSLRSIEYYRELISSSANCNTKLWYPEKNWEEEAEKLVSFVANRHKVLSEYFDTFSSIPDLPENRYYDVLPSEWYYDAVTRASVNGILNGVGNGFFRPEYKVRRSQAAQVVFNMSGVDEVAYTPLYSDVAIDAWYADAVTWSVLNEVFLGYPDGTFKPEENITREEFIDILYRFSGSPTVSTDSLDDFYDANLVTATNAMEWALSTGVLEGSDNRVNPNGHMSRAEFATILVRYYDLVINNK